jgi:hypothetical protein
MGGDVEAGITPCIKLHSAEDQRLAVRTLGLLIFSKDLKYSSNIRYPILQ